MWFTSPQPRLGKENPKAVPCHTRLRVVYVVVISSMYYVVVVDSLLRSACAVETKPLGLGVV